MIAKSLSGGRAMGALAMAALSSTACAVILEPFSRDEDTARAQLLREMPVGFDVHQALPLLERRGFRCQWHDQRPFYGVVGRYDYLDCDLTRAAGLLIERRWQLALIHREGRVVDARFGVSITGL